MEAPRAAGRPLSEPEPTTIADACERKVAAALERLGYDASSASGTILVDRIAVIVEENLVSGRIARVMRRAKRSGGEWDAGDLDAALPDDYVERVAVWYLREAGRVEQLAAGDPATWQQLVDFLRRRAARTLQRLGPPGAATTADDFAHEACEIIFRSRFPFDVAFDAWATRILNNQIRRRYQRVREYSDRAHALSLESALRANPGSGLSLGDLLSDPRGEAAFERVAVREWLLRAIARLKSRAQREVILAIYFEGLGNRETAARLGKSVTAVALLRMRGLRGLRKLLEE